MHQLGIRTHAELCELPAADYDRWQYFFSIEPAGHLVENWRAGVVTASLFNAVLKLNGADALSPADIFPDPHKTIQPIQPVSCESARNHFSSFKKLLG